MPADILKPPWKYYVREKVTLIIPTLNEERNIARVLKKIPRRLVDEIIVVDSSSDNTPSIAKGLGANVIHEVRRGYGRALHRGITSSKGDIIVYIDGDDTYDPCEISKIIQPIIEDEYEIVLGNRLHDNMDPTSMTRLNRIGNTVISSIFRALYKNDITDTQTGFRAIKKECVADLNNDYHGMNYVTEQLIKIIKNGARVGETPITYKPRISGRPKLNPIKDGLSIIWVMIKEKIKCVRSTQIL